MKNKNIQKIIAWTILLGMSIDLIPVKALTKDETVYTKLNTNGSVKNITVSEHLNDKGALNITDKTNLTDIKNINGSETYKEENGNLIWETNGNDIYYEGTTKNDLPIELDVKYYLDNQETPINEMLGKKGKIRISIKYINNSKHNVIINGKSTILYTPFVIATTSIIENTDNKNITVSNGKVVDNGTNSIVVALSSPGLSDSLNTNKLDNFDKVDITYDTESFELNSIYSVATSKIIDSSDLDIFDNVDKLYSKISTLSNASTQIVNGSKELAKGTNSLKEGANELKNGTKDAYNGSKTITDTVNNSISSMKTNTGLDDNTLNYIKNTATNQTIASVEANKENIMNQAMQSVVAKENNDHLIKQASDTSVTSNTTLINALKLAAHEAMKQDPNSAGVVEQCEAGNTAYCEYVVLAENQAIEKAKNDFYTNALNLAKATAAQTAYNTALNFASNQTATIAANVAESVAKNAQEQTITSLNKLADGLGSLTNGLAKINNGANTLYDGTAALNEGANKLATGINQFDKEGISTISSLVNGDIKDLQGRIENLIRLSNDYETLDNLSANTKGSSKIIYVIEAVKKQKEDSHIEKTVAPKKSLWQKIKGLFTK